MIDSGYLASRTHGHVGLWKQRYLVGDVLFTEFEIYSYFKSYNTQNVTF